MDYKFLKETSDQLDERELEYSGQRYPSSQVYKGLGLTRDALRYYEELGMLKPAKNEENSYREYSIGDIWNILTIDFYKKRGVSPKELKRAKDENSEEYYQKLLTDKRLEIKESIQYQKRMLKKLEETIAFQQAVETGLDVFHIRDFPLYEIEEEFSSIVNFQEYGKRLLAHIDTSEDDIFSNMIRVLKVDDHGYTGSQGYFVKRAKKKTAGGQYLETGPALYVMIMDSEENESLMEKMFVSCMEWAEEHGKKFKGVVYLKPKYISWLGDERKSYLECWVPIKN